MLGVEADLGVILFILTAGCHPYDVDNGASQQPDTRSVAPPSGKSTWQSFRSSVGQSYRLGSSALGSSVDVSRLLALRDASCSDQVGFLLKDRTAELITAKVV